VARAARLPLILLVLALAACGGGGKANTSQKRCPTTGRDVTFPLLDPKRPHTVDVLTNLGGFAFRLDVEDSPCVTSSFAALVRKGFFDGTVFHRIAPGFVIQGGDPTASGMGGPGYSTRDKVPAGAKYTKGVVAMAKAGSEPAGTAGSQFYVVTGADAGLPPDYAVIGKVTKGLPTVDRIGALGDQSEHPTQPVILYGVTAKSS
jgi:cyclophilin family peptidyl-prolyl cis-trans isomerase